MKIIAFTSFAASLGLNIALASASPFHFQMAQRLRGNHEARALELACGESAPRSTGCRFKSDEDGYKPTSYLSTSSISTTDESFLDWGASLDCPGIPMWEAGNKDKNNPEHASDAYLNWDCSTSTLCILVKVRDGLYIKNDTNLWFKEYSSGQDTQNPIGGVIQRFFNDADEMIAWEACYEINTVPSCLTSGVEVHANFDAIGSYGARTTSTGKEQTPAGYLALDLSCPCTSKAACQIDACYEDSTCVRPDGNAVPDDGTVEGTCIYAVKDNCCINDDDCAKGYTCYKNGSGEPEALGTCQLETSPPPPSPMEPSTSDGGSTSTTTPAPTPDPNECYVKEDCDIENFPDASKDCAEAVCNTSDNEPNFCAVQPKNVQPGSCDVNDNKDPDNTCYAGYPFLGAAEGSNVCNGVECVAAYKGRHAECRGPEAEADLFDSDCVEYTCQPDTAEGAVPGRTICVRKFIAANTSCYNPDFDPRGPCDGGDKCNGAGKCVASFKPSTDVCGESKGPCDAPEYCTGTSYVCPGDIKYGPSVQVVNEKGETVDGDKVCRGECESCPDDVPEVCPGLQDACPSDVIFQKELDLIAGKHYDAGYTTIIATELDKKTADGIPLVQVCVTIKLENEWELQKDDSGATKQDSIKMELNNVAKPQNSPGGYSHKDLVAHYDADAGVYTKCHSFPSEPSTIYFAAHLDVEHVEYGGQTAWALLPTATDGTASTTTGSLTPQVFTKDGHKKGPKVQVAATTEDGGGDGIGWGNWFTFEIGCASVNDKCSTSTSTGGGATTTTGTTVAPSTTATAHSYFGTCFDAGGDDLTCQHSAGSCTLNLFT